MGLFGKLQDLSNKIDDFINNKEGAKPQDVNMGVLSDPPAPPIPVGNERMSVSVAVNGKSYGLMKEPH